MPIDKAKTKTLSDLYQRASSFCAYQERTQQEVREKLYGDGADKDVTEEIIVKLIEEGFLNEERFAKAYAGGKFRMKKWGRIKIMHELKLRGISDYCIRKGMKEIEEEQYLETLKSLIEKKEKEEKEPNILKKKNKISHYLIRKGYEPSLVWEELNRWFEK